MKYIILPLFAFISHTLTAQTTVDIPLSFVLMYDQIPLVLNQNYHLSEKDSLEIEMLKFYISKIELYQDETKVYEEENSFHLINAADTNSLSFNLKVPEQLDFSHIQFHLGIDSLTNMSGALGGDLDPSKGMYWTWQTGYINFKLEGLSAICPTRHHSFQFHLGGYTSPYNSLQTIRLKKKSSLKNNDIKIITNIKKFIEAIDLEQQNQVMSLGEEAVELSKIAVNVFR